MFAQLEKLFAQLKLWQMGGFFATLTGGFVLSLVIITLCQKMFKRLSLGKIKQRVSFLTGLLLCKFVAVPFFLALPDHAYLHFFLMAMDVIACCLMLFLVNPVINMAFVLLSYQGKKNHGNWEGIFKILAGVVKIIAYPVLFLILPRYFVFFEQYNLSEWIGNITIGVSTITAVVGFASKDLISNFFGAVVIMVSKPFEVGDWIVVNKIEGRVVSIDIRATKLKTRLGTLIHVPNSLFTNKDITNYGHVSYQSFVLTLPLISLSQEKLKDFLNALNKVIKDNPNTIPSSSFITLSDVSQEKGKLTCHLSFEPMPEEETLEHVHGILHQVRDIAQQKEITIS